MVSARCRLELGWGVGLGGSLIKYLEYLLILREKVMGVEGRF